MKRLEKLFQKKFGSTPDKIAPLRSDGSDRKIYRIFKKSDTFIGVIGSNREENEAFLNFSKHFKRYSLNVPEIYIEDLSQGVYLEEDLGDKTLFQWMSDIREQEGFTAKIKQMYRKVVENLPVFQITAGSTIDYSYCYQHTMFGRESMSWDLHYFKHRFLNYYYKKKIDHTNLEKDFNTLIDFLLEEAPIYFLYRDFQSRNVMIKNDEPYFIDYQSGRKGALQYDLASMLYDSKANLPQDFREELVDVYIAKTKTLIDLDSTRFKTYFDGYVLIRIMQAFGAYGYLTAVLGKKQFFRSVPYAINNLKILLQKSIDIVDQLPVLKEIFSNLVEDLALAEIKDEKKLIVQINSFSYHLSGIPEDTTGHNGGFIFDCRFLPNPGREAKYKKITGKDEKVIRYFLKHKTVNEFLQHVSKIVEMAIENYKSRNFTNLMISFGCTGGQHRSVYCAERLAEYLKEKQVSVKLHHIELEKLNNVKN